MLPWLSEYKTCKINHSSCNNTSNVLAWWLFMAVPIHKEQLKAIVSTLQPIATNICRCKRDQHLCQIIRSQAPFLIHFPKIYTALRSRVTKKLWFSDCKKHHYLEKDARQTHKYYETSIGSGVALWQFAYLTITGAPWWCFPDFVISRAVLYIFEKRLASKMTEVTSQALYI